jgi:hypothetical protein
MRWREIVKLIFDVHKNTTRGWYHAPWMHACDAGREFIHGLTCERPSRPQELHPNQNGQWQNWAVSVYKPRGGHTIGRVWRNQNSPDRNGEISAVEVKGFVCGISKDAVSRLNFQRLLQDFLRANTRPTSYSRSRRIIDSARLCLN